MAKLSDNKFTNKVAKPNEKIDKTAIKVAVDPSSGLEQLFDKLASSGRGTPVSIDWKLGLTTGHEAELTIHGWFDPATKSFELHSVTIDNQGALTDEEAHEAESTMSLAKFDKLATEWALDAIADSGQYWQEDFKPRFDGGAPVAPTTPAATPVDDGNEIDEYTGLRKKDLRNLPKIGHGLPPIGTCNKCNATLDDNDLRFGRPNMCTGCSQIGEQEDWTCFDCGIQVGVGSSYCKTCMQKHQGDEPTCGNCGGPADKWSGFCSTECEDAYGACEGCGAPQRGGGRCINCREASKVAQVARCNCENTACTHRPGSCPDTAGKYKAIYVGPLCDVCASKLPDKYLQPIMTAQMELMSPTLGAPPPEKPKTLQPVHEGMWLPREIKKHFRKLRSMGYGINDADMAVADVLRQGAGGAGADDDRVKDYLKRLWYSTISTKPHEETLYRLASALYIEAAQPNEFEPCPECGGVGDIDAVSGHPHDPYTKSRIVECEVCHGSGVVICKECHTNPMLAGLGMCRECLSASEHDAGLGGDTLSSEDMQGTGKIGQATPPQPAPPPPPAPGQGGPQQMQPPMDAPPDGMPMPEEAEMSLQEAIDQLQEASQIVVEKVQNGETILNGENVAPVPPEDTGAMPGPAPKIGGKVASGQKCFVVFDTSFGEGSDWDGIAFHATTAQDALRMFRSKQTNSMVDEVPAMFHDDDQAKPVYSDGYLDVYGPYDCNCPDCANTRPPAKCECGADAVGGGIHSSWCPKSKIASRVASGPQIVSAHEGEGALIIIEFDDGAQFAYNLDQNSATLTLPDGTQEEFAGHDLSADESSNLYLNAILQHDFSSHTAADDDTYLPSILKNKSDPELAKQYVDRLRNSPKDLEIEKKRVNDSTAPSKADPGVTLYRKDPKPGQKRVVELGPKNEQGIPSFRAPSDPFKLDDPRGIERFHGDNIAELVKLRNEANTLYTLDRKKAPDNMYDHKDIPQHIRDLNDFIGTTGANKKDVIRYKEAIPRSILFKLERALGDWNVLTEQELRQAHDAMMELYEADKFANRRLMKMLDNSGDPGRGRDLQPGTKPPTPGTLKNTRSKQDLRNLIEQHRNTLNKMMPKKSVDDDAKGYYHDLYGDYGDDMTKDRVAEVIESTSDIFDQYGVKPDDKRFSRIVEFVAADLDDGSDYSDIMKVASADDKFATFIDRMMVNYILSSNVDNVFVDNRMPVVAKSSFFVNAMHNLNAKDKVMQYVADKMKVPKVKGQPDDEVKVEKMEDEAADSEPTKRNDHVDFEVTDSWRQGVYTHMQLKWNTSSDADNKSVEGIMQAIRSFVKGLESQKEPNDIGFLGKINVVELDEKKGTAEVMFRTMKSGDAETKVRT